MLSKSEQETFLALIIYDIYARMQERARKLERMVKAGINGNAPGAIDDARKRFMMDFSYMMEQMLFVNRIAMVFQITLHNEELIGRLRSYNEDEVIDHFTGARINWVERRFYTCGELQERADKVNEAAIKIIKRMRERGEL